MLLDLTNVNTSTYLPVGRHLVKVVDIKEEPEYIAVTFKNKDGAIHQERFYLKESVLWKIALLAKACKCIDDNNKQLDTNCLLGCYIYITLEEVDYNGKVYLNIAKFEASDIPKDTKVAEQKTKQQQPQLQNTPEVDIDEEDIPF